MEIFLWLQDKITDQGLSLKIPSAENRIEELLWKQTLQKNTKTSYNEFLWQYPNSNFKSEANEKLEAIDWQEATQKNIEIKYQEFINKYPNSANRLTAERRMEKILKAYEKCMRGCSEHITQRRIGGTVIYSFGATPCQRDCDEKYPGHGCAYTKDGKIKGCFRSVRYNLCKNNKWVSNLISLVQNNYEQSVL